MKKWFSLLLIWLLFPMLGLAETQNLEDVIKEDEFIISCDSTSINVSDQMVCRIGVANYGFSFDKISYDLEISDGLSIVDVRSNYDKLWKVDNSGASSSEENIGLQEFGIILIKSESSGEKTVKIKNILVGNSHNDNSKSYKDVEYKVKVISDDNDLDDIIIDNKSLDGFSKSKMTYSYYIDDSVNNITIDTVNSNEYSKVVGSGEYEIPLTVEKTIIPIEVISENGNKKIYKINVIRKNFEQNSIDKKIKSIKITNNKGNIILLNFKSELYSYSVEVNSDITSLKIEAEINEDVKFVSGFGEREVSISSGDNIILLKVVDEDGEVLNYEISVTKPLVNKSSNNYLKSLVIEGYDLKFSKRVRNYSLKVKKGTKSLVIKPVLEDDKASYEIVGNSSIEDGSVVKIIVTAENQVKNTYQITIGYKSGNYMISAVIGICLFGLVYFAWKKRSSLNKKAGKTRKNKVTHSAGKKNSLVSKKNSKAKGKASKKVVSKPKKSSKGDAKKNTKSAAKKGNATTASSKGKTKASNKTKTSKKPKTNGKNKKRKKKKK